MSKKLKEYNRVQAGKVPKQEEEPSGVACPNCDGEMMIQLPEEEHYVKGRRGEKGAVKSDLVRAICSKCKWKGWV